MDVTGTDDQDHAAHEVDAEEDAAEHDAESDHDDAEHDRDRAARSPRCKIRVPVRVVDALLSGTGETLDCPRQVIQPDAPIRRASRALG